MRLEIALQPRLVSAANRRNAFTARSTYQKYYRRKTWPKIWTKFGNEPSFQRNTGGTISVQ